MEMPSLLDNPKLATLLSDLSRDGYRRIRRAAGLLGNLDGFI
jgi:hypothetical protein